MAQVVKPPVQVNEARWLTITFEKKERLIDGDSLTSILSFVVTRGTDGVDVTSDMVEPASPSIIGKKMTFLKRYGGGANGNDYHAEALIGTALGEKLPEVLIIEVRDE